MKTARSALLVSFFSCILPAAARADATDLFGLDARAKGMANAVVSLATDWSAAAHNPAGAASASKISVGAGYSYSHASFNINGRDAELMEIRGTSLGVTLPFKLPRNLVLAFGIAAYLPDQFLARVQMIPAYEPRYVLLDNRPHRAVISPVVALKMLRYLSIGVGATILSDATGEITLNVGVKGGTKVGETSLDVSLPTRAAPYVGILFGPIAGFSFGAVYRGAIDLRTSFDIVANVDVAGIVTGDAVLTMRAANYFTPQKVVAGLSYTWAERVFVGASLQWTNWSAFRKGIPELRIMVDLGINPPMLEARFPLDNFSDILTMRTGGEYRLRLKDDQKLAFRLGYMFEPSPTPAQVGMTGLLHNDRHAVTMGLGYCIGRISKIFPYALSVDLAFQYHRLVPRSDERNLAWVSPGGGKIRYDGHLFHLALTGGLEF